MAYDEKLADRIRRVLGKRKSLTEKKMFGGIAFMLRGNMCCGPRRPMKRLIIVTPRGHKTDDALRKWVRQAADSAASLPAK